MNWIVAKIKWILLASGVVTCSALYAAIAPDQALEFLFARSLENSAAQLVVRHWAVLVTLMGALLIHGALDPRHRAPILVLVGLEKLAFLGLMFGFGRRYLAENAGIALGLELVMVGFFVAYLIGVRRSGSRQDGPTRHAMPGASRPQTSMRPAPRPPLVKSP